MGASFKHLKYNFAPIIFLRHKKIFYYLKKAVSSQHSAVSKIIFFKLLRGFQPRLNNPDYGGLQGILTIAKKAEGRSSDSGG